MITQDLLEQYRAEKSLNIPENMKWRNNPKWVFKPGDADYFVVSGMIQCVDATKDYLYDAYTPLRVSPSAEDHPLIEEAVRELSLIHI